MVKQKMDEFGVAAVLNARDEQWNRNCLNHAATLNSDPSLVWLLLQSGANPDDGGDGNQWTPLVRASYNGMTSNVELLLAYGADPKLFHSNALKRVKAKDDFNQQRKISRLLMRHGADPNDKDPRPNNKESGMSPFEYAVDSFHLGQVREMAKWMETIPDGSFNSTIQHEIKEGQKERLTFSGDKMIYEKIEPETEADRQTDRQRRHIIFKALDLHFYKIANVLKIVFQH